MPVLKTLLYIYTNILVPVFRDFLYMFICLHVCQEAMDFWHAGCACPWIKLIQLNGRLHMYNVPNIQQIYSVYVGHGYCVRA